MKSKIIFFLILSFFSKTILPAKEKETKESKTNIIDQILQAAKTGKFDKDQIKNINSQDADGFTALMYAIAENNTKAVSELISSGADLNIRDKNNQTALIHASIEGNKDIVRLLIKSKANLDLQDKYGKTALLWALDSDKPEIVELLILADASINISDNDGLTPLMIAALKNLKDVANLILKRKEILENLNKQDRYGRTALIHAVANGNIDFINLLLKAGARILIKDSYGNTALDIAKNRAKAFGEKSGQQERFGEIIKILENAQEELKKRSNKIFSFINYVDKEYTSEDIKKIEGLLKNEEIDLNIENQEFANQTPLTNALVDAMGRENKKLVYELIELLLKYNADPTYINTTNIKKGLVIELINHDLNLAKLLIKYGIDLNAQQNNALNALRIAIYNYDVDFLKFLLEHGANPSIIFKDYNYDEEALKFLLDNDANAYKIAIKDYNALDFARKQLNELSEKYKKDVKIHEEIHGFGKFPEEKTLRESLIEIIKILEDYMKKNKKSGDKS